MKNDNKHSIGLHLLILFIGSALLGGCGESTNLADPNEIVSTSECSDLESANDTLTCVPGYFVNDAVANLNYSCGKVNAVTDVAGKFTCPAGSMVEFSLLNPDDTSDTAKKIVLGELLVKSLPKKYSSNTALYITPKDFGDTYANNIVRLLQTLRQDDGVSDEMPTRKVTLLDEDKKKLTHLVTSVTAADFALAPSDFNALLQPYLDSLSPTKTLISVSQANIFLKKGIHASVAGSYFVPVYLLTVGFRPGNASYDGDYGGIRGISASDYLLAATWNLVDRKGRVAGFGVYSTGPVDLPGVTDAEYNACKLLIFTSCAYQPPRNTLRQIPDGGLLWSNWIDDGSWRFSYNLTDASGNALPANIFSFTSGKMDRGAIAGSPFLYKMIFDETYQSEIELGHWRLIGSPDFSAASDTSFTITRLRGIAPSLDSRFWDPVKLTFPLDAKLTFLQDDKVTPLATLRILIMSDGNIVSNIHGRCGDGLDSNSLKYSNGDAEFPLGVVAQAFDAKNAGGRTYITPMILVPDDDLFPAILRNVQVGTANGAAAVRMRVDKADPASYLKMYLDSGFSDDGFATDTDRSAAWTNYVNPYKTGAASASTSSGYVISQEDVCP